MLQHNAPRRAHVAHAALVGLHAFCCGLPALTMLAAVLAGATSSVLLVSRLVGDLHRALHAHELWLLALSALLVVSGGVLETGARRNGARLRFPWLYALSVACFVANIAIIAGHRI